MATNTNNLSRRETLVGIALCCATAATPITGATIAKAMQLPDRKAWDRALADFRRIEARHDALWDAYFDAEEAHGNENERVDRYFDDYGLGM